MQMFVRAAIWLPALLACAPALAVEATTSRAPAGYAPEYAPVTVPATSTPLTGTLAASGTAGPFAPQLGRTIWATLTGTWSGTVQVGTTITGACADAIPLTIGGQAWGSYSGNVNEPVGEETRAGAGWCLTATIASGTLAYRVAQ